MSVRELRQIDWLTPGMIGLLLLWGNLTVGIVLAEWRKTGVMKRLAATPLRSGTLVSTQMLARLLLSLVQCAILLALALFIFNVHVVGNWGLLALTIAIGALTLMSHRLHRRQFRSLAGGRQRHHAAGHLPDDVPRRHLLPHHRRAGLPQAHHPGLAVELP